MLTYLITGGAGYIGSHVCKALSALGHIPVVYDNFAKGWHDAVKFGPLEQGDVTDLDRLTDVLTRYRPAGVIHCAALTEVAASIRAPETFWQTNVVGTKTLLDAMCATQVGRLIYSSTCAVHGNLDGVLLDEDTPFAPTSPYAASKLAVEFMVRDYAARYDLRALGFRYFNVAGADAAAELGEFHRPETHLIPLALEAVSGQRDMLSVFGDDYPTPDGTCIRDYVHVSDLVDAHLTGLAYLEQDARLPIITLGTGRGFSVHDVLAATTAVTGLPVPHEIAPRRQGDPAKLVCGSTRAHEELGWSPARSDLPTMIADAWRWHQGPGFRQ